jgi:Big-like domain-containing protein
MRCGNALLQFCKLILALGTEAFRQGLVMKWNSKRSLLIAAALCGLAFAAGCTGFFVSPTLTSLQIGPQNQTLTANPPQNLQMSATGTFSDGSTQDLTGKVLWSSATTSCATVSPAGLVTPVKTVSGVCTTTISAADGTISPATTMVTVSEGTPTSITLSVTPTNTPTQASTVTFKALATFPNSSTQQDITSSVTWVNSNTTDLTLTNGSGTGTISATAGIGDVIDVTATFAGESSNTVQLTVQ